VQFLSLAGKIGGSKSSPVLREFSSGFGWANYRLGNVCFVGCARNDTAEEGKQSAPSSSYSRRTTDKKTGGGEEAVMGTRGGEESVGTDSCSEWGAEQAQVDSIITCILCLIVVGVLREGVCYTLRHVLHRPVSDDLRFPAWEASGFSRLFYC